MALQSSEPTRESPKILSALVSLPHNQQHVNPRGPVWQATDAVCHSAGSQVQDETDIGRTN